MKKILLSVALLASATSFAQSNSFKPGFYAGIEAGVAKVKDSSNATVAELLAQNGVASASANQDSTVNAGKIFAGYKVTENFDIEVGYLKSTNVEQNFSGVDNSSRTFSGINKTKFSGYDYSLIMRPNLSTGWNNAFLAVGGHHTKMKGTSNYINTSGNSISESGKTSGNGYLYAAGYDANIAKNMDIRFKITRLERIADLSQGKATFFSVGVLSKF